MNKQFIIYKDPDYKNTEYFISPNTGRRVYTRIEGVKQNVDYRGEGVSREAFTNFVNKNKNYGTGKTLKKPQNRDREHFVSTGSMGANYNKDMDTITGPAIFTNQMLEHGTTWKDMKERTDKTGVASDGVNILGAGPGNNYDQAMKSHIKNMEILEAANNEYNTPEILKQINKNINTDLNSNPVTSMYNRGNQTKSKIIDLPDRAVGVLPEEFYPERCKNRNIYKTNELIPIAGFDVHEDRLGEDASQTHSVLYCKRSHGRRSPAATPSGSTLETRFGNIIPPDFSATIGAEFSPAGTYDKTPSGKKQEKFAPLTNNSENNLGKRFVGCEGGNKSYWMPKKFSY